MRWERSDSIPQCGKRWSTLEHMMWAGRIVPHLREHICNELVGHESDCSHLCLACGQLQPVKETT